MITIAATSDEEWREVLARSALSLIPAREPNENFKDCFDRPIAIGDVLAHGFRAGNYGGIHVGIVYGFTDSTIQIYCVDEIVHYERKPDERISRKVVDGYRLVRRNTRIASNTFITGLTEQQLRQQLGIVSGTMGHEIESIREVNVKALYD